MASCSCMMKDKKPSDYSDDSECDDDSDYTDCSDDSDVSYDTEEEAELEALLEDRVFLDFFFGSEREGKDSRDRLSNKEKKKCKEMTQELTRTFEDIRKILPDKELSYLQIMMHMPRYVKILGALASLLTDLSYEQFYDVAVDLFEAEQAAVAAKKRNMRAIPKKKRRQSKSKKN